MTGVVLLGAALAGCSESGGDGGGSAGDATSTATAEQSADAQPTAGAEQAAGADESAGADAGGSAGVDGAAGGTGPEETRSEPPAADEPVTPGRVLVRDAFAGMQATLDDTCTPGAGDCGYFLGRVYDELVRLEGAMRNDPKGPGHFPEPLKWIEGLRGTIDGDTSVDNLEAHMKELVGVRDRINVWMQDHPDDYR